MSRDILYPLRRLHGICHSLLVYIKSSAALILKKRVYILGTPQHTNLGDAAIVIAQKLFIKRAGIKEKDIVEIPIENYPQFRELPLKLANKKSLITLVGGGNMGDVWFGDEDIRRKIISDFPKNRKIVFPQTCFYSDTESGKAEKERSVEIYNSANNLTLIARESKSFDIMKALYPNADIMLVPDIVLSANADDFGVKKQKRSGVLLCMRKDLEKSLDAKNVERIVQYLDEKSILYTLTDTHSTEWCFADKRENLVRQKLNEFAGAELIITDRLHGMVFAAITQTPCIVFSNYNQKVEGTYNWIKNLPYIEFAKNSDDAIASIEKLIKLENCLFDNSSLTPYFDKIKQLIKV